MFKGHPASEIVRELMSLIVVVSVLYASIKLTMLAILPEANERQLALANAAFIVLSNLLTSVTSYHFGRISKTTKP